MTHLEVIPLIEAKDYLGLDDDSRDGEVTRMIKSAIRWVEKRTNHILVARTKTYDLENGCARIYDYPYTLPANFTQELKSAYAIVTSDDEETESIELALGYDTLVEIPDDLVECAYLILKFFFYEQEGNGRIPLAAEEIVDYYKRYIV